MALETPLTSEVKDQIVAQLEASLNQTIPLLPRAFNRVLAKVLAGVFIILWKYAGWMFLQMFITTASNDLTEINGRQIRPLTEWGRQLGVGDPTAATRAKMTVDVVGTAVDTLIGGTQVRSDDNGFVYITIGDTASIIGTFSVTIQAVKSPDGGNGGGELGNLDIGSTLSFVSTPDFVARDVTVTANTVLGADAETEEDYRSRVLDRWQSPPQGGAPGDYRGWMTEHPDVINAYVYKGDPGQINGYSEVSNQVDGIPTAGQLEDIKDDYVDVDDAGLATRRPANDFFNSLPITRPSYDTAVIALTDPNDLNAARTDIVEALEIYYLSREPYIPGLSVGIRMDQITQAGAGGVVQNVVASRGGTFFGVTVVKGIDVIEVYNLAEGEKAKSGSVTWP